MDQLALAARLKPLWADSSRKWTTLFQDDQDL